MPFFSKKRQKKRLNCSSKKILKSWISHQKPFSSQCFYRHVDGGFKNRAQTLSRKHQRNFRSVVKNWKKKVFKNNLPRNVPLDMYKALSFNLPKLLSSKRQKCFVQWPSLLKKTFWIQFSWKSSLGHVESSFDNAA